MPSNDLRIVSIIIPCFFIPTTTVYFWHEEVKVGTIMGVFMVDRTGVVRCWRSTFHVHFLHVLVTFMSIQ